MYNDILNSGSLHNPQSRAMQSKSVKTRRNRLTYSIAFVVLLLSTTSFFAAFILTFVNDHMGKVLVDSANQEIIIETVKYSPILWAGTSAILMSFCTLTMGMLEKRGQKDNKEALSITIIFTSLLFSLGVFFISFSPSPHEVAEHYIRANMPNITAIDSDFLHFDKAKVAYALSVIETGYRLNVPNGEGFKLASENIEEAPMAEESIVYE